MRSRGETASIASPRNLSSVTHALPEVVDQLELFLGLKKPGENGAGNANPFQQMMMQRMQMMQQQGQQPGQQPAAMQAPPEIHLMANTRRNTVIVNAPPDKMGIIKSAIWKIDVPSDRPSLSDNTQLMQPYRLTTVDPEVVVSFLQTVADLDPQTKLDIDKKTHTVIAYASLKDQKVISALVKNLDSADRNLKVIQLRRLDADLVAGTIRMLMVGDDKNKNDNNNNGGGRRFGWFMRDDLQRQRGAIDQQVPRRSRYRPKPAAGLCRRRRVGEGLQVPRRDGRGAGPRARRRYDARH